MVLEYWQEKAVFEQGAEEYLITARRPNHPLGKCIATTSLLAYLITAKYADGLPLYRLEQIFKRLGHALSRTNMAHWIIYSACTRADRRGRHTGKTRALAAMECRA